MFLYTKKKKRCRAVLQRLTPAHKVFRDRMTKKCMQFHVSSPKQTKCNTSELLASFPKWTCFFAWGKARGVPDDVHCTFSIQSCRSCYATLHLCQRSFHKIFVKFRNSKKNVLKNVLIIVNINKDENKSLISNQFSLKNDLWSFLTF